jgi:plasmid stabilization system protein ParE
MSLNVFYTPAAKETLSAVYFFIREKFGVRSADKFLVKAEKSIALIAAYPLMFKASQIDESVRVVLSVNKQLFFTR